MLLTIPTNWVPSKTGRWLMWCRVINCATSNSVQSGGMVVKNVAGYDLCKLYAGSRGTLGTIVELTFKLFPRPEASLSRRG